MKIQLFFPGIIGELQRAMLVATIFLALVILGAVLWPWGAAIYGGMAAVALTPRLRRWAAGRFVRGAELAEMRCPNAFAHNGHSCGWCGEADRGGAYSKDWQRTLGAAVLRFLAGNHLPVRYREGGDR